MKSTGNVEFDKNKILSKCFYCLVEKGLEKTTTRDICSATGLQSSSLYYWFKNKDEIIVDATLWGMNHIVDELFTAAYSHLRDLNVLFAEFPKEALKFKFELKFIYQVVTSPQYGSSLREISAQLPMAYDSYSKVLANQLGCKYDDIRPIVYMFIAITVDFIVWEDDTKAEMQFEYLHAQLSKLIKR